METKYDFTKISQLWKFCFNGECPKSSHCLRYLAGCQLPDNRVWGPAVYPTACKNGKCPFYRTAEKVTLATGFVTKDRYVNTFFQSLRRDVAAYLGGNGTYYLYRNGKKWLSPEQQENILKIFRSKGFQGEIHWQYTKEDYNFL